MSLVLGLDGGGTKTAAVLMDSGRRELGRGRGGPCNIATCEDQQLREAVREAAGSALASAGLPRDTRLASVCAGVAGYTARLRRPEFLTILAEEAPAESHRLEPDYVIAYWGATGGQPGIVVSVGTGTVLYGRNADGQTKRLDGRGFLFGDRGSAFDLAREQLNQLLQQLDGNRRLSPMQEALMQEIGAVDADDVVSWTYTSFQPARIAALAAIIGRWADDGDEEAAFRIMLSASLLGASANAIVKTLELPAETTPIYLLGGMWGACAQMKTDFINYLARKASRDPEARPLDLDIREPLHNAAAGAALLALSELEPGPSGN